MNDLHNYIGIFNGLTNVTVDYEKVDSSIKKLKCGKACGVDNIPNEFRKYGGHMNDDRLFGGSL